MRHHAVEQPQVARLGGGHHARAPHQLERLGRAHETGQEERPTPVGDQTELVEYLPDGRLVRRDAIVARQRQIGAAARGRAVYRRQDGLGRPANRERNRLARGHERRTVPAEHPQIGPGAERPARAREGDDAHRLAAAQQSQRLEQLVAHGAVEGVQLLRAVQRHAADPGRDLHEDALVGRHHARSTIIAMPWPTPMHIVASP